MFELIESHDVEVPPTSFVDVIDDKMLFYLRGDAFCYVNKIIIKSMAKTFQN